MGWHKAGTVSVATGQNVVTGTGTGFADNARVGDEFKGPDGAGYEIINIASSTVLTIDPSYLGPTVAAGAYSIVPIQGYNKDSADRLRAVSQGLAGFEEKVEEAKQAADAAVVSANNASGSATAAGESEAAASAAAGNTIAARDAAQSAAQSADGSKQAAQSSAQAAANSAEAAAEAASSVAQVVVAVNTSRPILASELGLVLIDAQAGAVTITLPAANASLGVRDVVLRRVDHAGSRLVVQATGTDRIKLHTHLRAEGYPFLVLMGAGDWWHLRSDKAGAWWPVGRFDSTPVGRPVFETTTAFQPGGYGGLGGPVLQRADWPWLWDHAQASGMLVTEANRTGREGAWTSGDGSATFRGPEGRGEFLRILDEGRAVDSSRLAGSSQGDAIRNMTGSAAAVFRAVGAGAAGVLSMTQYGATPPRAGTAGADAGDSATVTFDASRQVPTSTENRPRNIAWPGRIKLI